MIAALGAVLLAAAAAAPSDAAPAATGETPPSCDAPPEARAPDPACGEQLDGRAPPGDGSAGVQAGRALLWPPRLASRIVLWPVLKTTELAEEHHVPGWIAAVLTSDDGKVGVRPVLAYATSFLPTVGLRAFYRRLPGDGTEIAGSFRTAGPAVMLADLDLVLPRPWGIVLHGTWNHRNDRLFAGIGPNSMSDLEARGEGVARFGSDIALGELRWARTLVRQLSITLHTDGQVRAYRADNVRGGPSIAELYGSQTPACVGSEANACVSPVQVPGFQSGLQIIHGGGGLTWDARSRDRDGSGVTVALDATYGHGVANDPSNQVTFSSEVVGALGGSDRVLLARARAATIHNFAVTPVQFEELIIPSGVLGIRGLAEGRLRGTTGVVGTLEYRWYVANKLDASIFTDVGTVAAGPGFSGFRADRLFPDVGVGLRFLDERELYWKAQPKAGVELAYSPDGGFRMLLAVAPF